MPTYEQARQEQWARETPGYRQTKLVDSGPALLVLFVAFMMIMMCCGLSTIAGDVNNWFSLTIPAYAKAPELTIKSINALEIVVEDCAPPANEYRPYGFLYINYRELKYQQVVVLTYAGVAESGCRLIEAENWHRDGGTATVVSGIVYYGSEYSLVSGMPVSMDVVYLPLIRK